MPKPAPGAPSGASGLRERILAAKDIASEPVHVPEWGVTVTVRGLTGSERDRIEALLTDEKGRVDRSRAGDFRATFAAMAIVDEGGRRVFSDADIKALGEKSSTALQRVFDAAVRLSATRPGDVDGIADDLKGDPSGDTGSD
jgi:hypothetical protein